MSTSFILIFYPCISPSVLSLPLVFFPLSIIYFPSFLLFSLSFSTSSLPLFFPSLLTQFSTFLSYPPPPPLPPDPLIPLPILFIINSLLPFLLCFYSSLILCLTFPSSAFSPFLLPSLTLFLLPVPPFHVRFLSPLPPSLPSLLFP